MKNLFSWFEVLAICGVGGAIGGGITEMIVQKVETKKRKKAIQEIIDKAMETAKQEKIVLDEDLIKKINDD